MPPERPNVDSRVAMLPTISCRAFVRPFGLNRKWSSDLFGGTWKTPETFEARVRIFVCLGCTEFRRAASAFSRPRRDGRENRLESHGIQTELAPFGQAHPRRTLPEGSSAPDQLTLRTIEQERNAVLVGQRPQIRIGLRTFSERVRQCAQMAHNLRRELLQQRQEFEAHARAQNRLCRFEGSSAKAQLVAAEVQSDV